ncbi:MAG: NADH-quinone oxidoreductase subunit L [Candidatus Methanomethylophilus sp.]|jgi:NADH-quinone oxidoreductase subunit L|nr:NADH-quinone oxidoreductase subunit L [Methanomethylophilus sp.]MCI2093646.1 NADH-quinone oxidoreductase subunit L [Methanomethylophilus sp.]TQS76739.1 MAG: proton-translocating NADH-quinone oxidoreductase subunit L [Methanomethylophilus alvi]WII08728.1 proton-conducting transporter membrane subunit [Methanomassiliicoccales archaeon LGM-DZ1]
MEFIDFVWLVPLVPMLCFLIVGFFGRYMGPKQHYGGYLTIFGAAFAFVYAALVSAEYWLGDSYPHAVESSMHWFSIGSLDINLGYYIDSLSCLMMLFASFISMLIFIYSLGYMGDQGERKRRYFAEVSLFLTGMLGLAVSGSLLTMFIFWEVMGLCSYLLIGFWGFNHPEAPQKASAAKKAFLVTRAGDVCLMGGLFVLAYAMGSLDYSVVFNMDNLEAADQSMLTLASFLIFGGAIGKSAQFPLLDWLPDAMAGPTTVSALIHAATMVKAGVYLVARCFPLFAMNSEVMLFVAIIGGVTAFFTATMAMNNMNIKKVLAYSTLSQLGYMFLSLGAGGYLFALGIESGDTAMMAAGALGYTAGTLHMANHAFFKALLFLCSGAVIHETGTEDMRLMGGLQQKMPYTSTTMLIGALSIAGFPFFAGFWSKDLVLDVAFDAFNDTADITSWCFLLLWFLGVVTAFMTAFYMFRLWFMTFRGEPRENAKAVEHDAPRCMTMPLLVLSLFAFAFGYTLLFGWDGVFTISLGSSGWKVGGGEADMGFHWVEELFTNWKTYLTIILVLCAIALAYCMYDKRSIDPGKFSKNGTSRLYRVLQNRWYLPEIYDQVAWKLGYDVALGVDYFDRNVIDGTVNGLSNAVISGGDLMSKAQNGNVHTYTGVVIGGVVALALFTLAMIYVFGGM